MTKEEKRSMKAYSFFRQAKELEGAIRQAGNGNRYFNDALRITDALCDELYRVVGELAAYEIDREYEKNQEIPPF